MRTGMAWQSGAFGQYLRTGRFTIRQPIEVKFNPYHDPDDGRFTFRPGGGTLAERRQSASASAPPKAARMPKSSQGARRPAASERSVPPYISSLHVEMDSLGQRYRAESGTQEWGNLNSVREKLGLIDDTAFKRQWVRGYRRPIIEAARRFDLPAGIVAGVAYKEASGKPEISDPGMYAVRNDVRRDRTSFGPLSIQVRRGAESLGYGSSAQLSESSRRALIVSLSHRETNIFIAAKHLSDLRDRYVRGLDSQHFSRQQIEALGTLYNSGPGAIVGGKVTSGHYGQEIARRWTQLNELIRN